MIKAIWISNRILNLNCNAESNGGRAVKNEVWQRPYKTWEHARNLIESGTNNFYFADGILNLKRCLDYRLKLIEEIYHLRCINFKNKENGYLEMLGQYGVVRPYFIKRLFEIRNDIEHNEAEAPEKERCMELLDVTWYFLKSTDEIVKVIRHDVDLSYCDENDTENGFRYNIQIDFDNNFSTEIIGRLPRNLISKEEREGFLKVLPKEYPELGNNNVKMTYVSKPVSDVVVIGKIAFTKDELFFILKQIFLNPI